MAGRRPEKTMLPSRRAQVDAITVRRVEVRVLEGPDEGAQARMVGRSMRIGTDPSNDLVLSDPSVSRFHVRLASADTGLRITDRRSANGTITGGLRVRDAVLASDTRLLLGDTVVELRLGDEERVDVPPESSFGGVIGQSLVMRDLFATARRAALSASTVLLLGETGTGKDALARAIHQHSPRSGPFIVFDCGAAAQSLIESAIFGHVRGAFTGAESDRPGVFEMAGGGTLFLDEIGELPLELQPKLLRVLDTGVVTRVGSSEEIPVDARVIAATNRDLHEEVAADRFRSDLFYRLAVIPLELPPLRERREDIPVLAGHFLREFLAHPESGLDWLAPHLGETFGALQRRPWPGNVRELRNVVERAAALADPEVLARDSVQRLQELRRSLGESLRGRLPLAQAREHFDREYLRDLLSEVSGDLDEAARVAGMHRKSIERLLRRYDVERAAVTNS